VQLAVGFALFAVLPYVMIRRGHVTIDLFEFYFGRLGNRILELLGDLTLAAIAYLLMSRQWFLIFKKARRDDPLWGELFVRGDWGEISDRLRDSQESQILGLPLWPTYLVAEFCTIVFFVVAVFCVVRSARKMFNPHLMEA
jgi:TRAP-type C4-dicarboxylate transport system permease small subunit